MYKNFERYQEPGASSIRLTYADDRELLRFNQKATPPAVKRTKPLKNWVTQLQQVQKSQDQTAFEAGGLAR